jgi:5-methyltetrahydrofolate--homocysteine methyltransferase
MKTDLNALMAAGAPVIADGGMGTMLFAAGLPRGSAPELWNVEQPEAVRAVHRAYAEAGAQILLTNSFGGSRLRLAVHHLDGRAAELNEAAARLARAEADAAVGPVLVGGSMGPTGQLIEPMGALPFDQARAAFQEQAQALAEGGVDVFWIETMSDLEEVRAAVEACARAAPGVPVLATLTFDTRGRTMMGVTPQRAVEALQDLGVAALGANCGNGPGELVEAVAQMTLANPRVPLVAKANAGLPRVEEGVTVYDATPEVMGDYAAQVRAAGAAIVGACCGSTPDHIRAIARALRAG